MPAKIYWINQLPNSAKLGIMARPRGNDWLDEDIASLKLQNVKILVSLLEREEIAELELMYEEEICKERDIEFYNYPIGDRDIPKKSQSLELLISNLVNELNNGKNVVIHCRMGIGRSSLIAASILLKFGFKASNIFDTISLARGLKVPDTDEQIKWLFARQ